jgi:hypothetical protein
MAQKLSEKPFDPAARDHTLGWSEAPARRHVECASHACARQLCCRTPYPFSDSLLGNRKEIRILCPHVIPAKAGIQGSGCMWIPAFAGMTHTRLLHCQNNQNKPERRLQVVCPETLFNQRIELRQSGVSVADQPHDCRGQLQICDNRASICVICVPLQDFDAALIGVGRT